MTGKVFSPLEMIERLVSFDTTSAKSNLELIAFVEDYLDSHGIRHHRFANSEGNKSNLLCSVGPDVKGGIVLSGHSDVVPVTDQAWDSDPFTAVAKDGLLYGRGTADMKSFLAIALAMVPTFKESRLTKPIHIALSYDEEVGCLGVGSMIEGLKDVIPTPSIVLVGEPTSMQVVNAHKGVFGFHTTIDGQAAHSSLPHLGASANLAAGRLVNLIADLAEEKRQSASADCPFEPPYTTFNVGQINGGTALNIVPRHCEFVWEFRLLPGDDAQAIIARYEAAVAEEVLPYLRATFPAAQITTRSICTVPPLEPEENGAAEALACHLTGANATNVVAYGTEGGMFQAAGLSTVVCGPGSIEQAHKPNEFIALSQVEACENFMRKLAAWLSHPST